MCMFHAAITAGTKFVHIYLVLHFLLDHNYLKLTITVKIHAIDVVSDMKCVCQ